MMTQASLSFSFSLSFLYLQPVLTSALSSFSFFFHFPFIFSHFCVVFLLFSSFLSSTLYHSSAASIPLSFPSIFLTISHNLPSFSCLFSSFHSHFPAFKELQIFSVIPLSSQFNTLFFFPSYSLFSIS